MSLEHWCAKISQMDFYLRSECNHWWSRLYLQISHVLALHDQLCNWMHVDFNFGLCYFSFWPFKLLNCLFIKLWQITCKKLEENKSREKYTHSLQWENSEASADCSILPQNIFASLISKPSLFLLYKGSQHVIHPFGRRRKGKGHSHLNIIIANWISLPLRVKGIRDLQRSLQHDINLQRLALCSSYFPSRSWADYNSCWFKSIFNKYEKMN